MYGDPPLSRGYKKRVRSEDTAADGTASVQEPPAKDKTHHLDSEPRKRRLPIASLLNDVNHSPKDQVHASLIQVKRESKDAATLVALLSFLDGTNIPEFMLQRAKEPQGDWGPSGEVQQVPVTEVGFNRDVLSLVSDDAKIDKSIKLLEAAKLITSNSGAYGRRTLYLDSAKQLYLTEIVDDPFAWRLQALILVCHTFPMNSYVEPL